MIRCIDETRAYASLAGDLKLDASEKPISGFKIPRWTEQLNSNPLCDFGIPERPVRFYSGQRILFLVRDARDVVASMLKLDVAGRSWLETWALPILDAKARLDQAFASRYAEELRIVEAAELPQIAAAALYWKYKNDALLDYLEQGYPVMPVSYEDLTAQPDLHLRRICCFLGVPWEAGLLDHPHAPHGEVFSNGLTVGNTDPQRSIDRDSVGQWRRHLSEEACAQLSAILQDTPFEMETAIKRFAHGRIQIGTLSGVLRSAAAGL